MDERGDPKKGEKNPPDALHSRTGVQVGGDTNVEGGGWNVRKMSRAWRQVWSGLVGVGVGVIVGEVR